MFEIYERHADEYHRLVSAEDYQANLSALLHRLVDWSGARVLEAGVGTGRVTDMYIEAVASAVCCDASEHMLAFARERLGDYADKLTFRRADNLDLLELSEQVDVFVEGWSFGHAVAEAPRPEQVARTTDALVAAASGSVVPGGRVVLIETMGTNVDAPAAPLETLAAMYRRLEEEHGFTRHEVRTDFRFGSVGEAAEVMGFFFGPEMAEGVQARSTEVVPEWTGVWVRRSAER
mgnify:FL=1